MALHVSKMKGRKPWEAAFFEGTAFDLHTHSFFEVMVSLQDGGTHHLGERTLPMRRGDLFLLGPYHIHRAMYPAGPGIRHFNLAFHSASLMGNGPVRPETWSVLHPFLTPTFPLPLRLPNGDFQNLLSLMDILHREGPGKDPWSEAIGMGALQSFLHLLARHYPVTGVPQDPAVLATLHRIADRYHEDLSTRELADLESLSPARLAQRFRKATGRTIKDTLTERRLLQARHLLTGTALTVTEIMDATGFNDLSYFNRAFRSAVGCSPSAFRQTRS